jgi:CHAT domain-containing protein/tetratricopeptide (TPR) repeat protein
VRTRLAIIVFFAMATGAHAQNQADRASMGADVWERIIARLEALPDRWDQLPVPILPPSGRLPEHVLDAATEVEREAADALLSRLVRTPPQKRVRLLAEVRGQHTLNEVDVWWPLRIARQQQFHSFDEAALTLDALLDLAEHLGRRDVLLHAAGAALELASRRLPPAHLITVAKRWSTLPPIPHGVHGAASVNGAYGSILSRIHHDREALDAYRTAERLYLAVGDQLGQGHSLIGEANVLFYLDQHDSALTIYRQVRSIFSFAGDQLGEGHSWIGEARVLDLLGQNEGALVAYQQARALYSAVGDRVGEANSWVGEAHVLLYQLGQNEGALSAFRQARVLYSAAGSQVGQAHAWDGEGDILFVLGQTDGALAAYRQARALYSAIGDQLGQGNSWDGEGDAFLRLGQNHKALAAYRQARSFSSAVGDQLGQGYSWLGEARVLFLLGQSEGAVAAYRQARSLSSAAGDQFGQGQSWEGEGDVLLRLGQKEEALATYRQARSLYISAGSLIGQGSAWDSEADALFQLGQSDGALAAYRQARALFSAVGDQALQGNAWYGEARVLFRLKELGPALRAAENAARLAKNMKITQNELSARIIEAHILLASKQEARAIRRAEDALALFRRWRQIGVSDIDRTGRSDVEVPYDILVPLLARKRGPAVEKALALADEAHAPVLLDILTTGGRRPEDTPDLSLREERDELQHRLAQLDRELQDSIAPSQRQKLLRDRAVLDGQLELNELIALGSLDTTFVNGAPIDARSRHALVHEVGPILLYHVAEDETTVFLLQPDHRVPVVRHIGLSRAQLQRDVHALRHDLANPAWKQDSRNRQRALFDQFVAPFADILAATPRVAIIPHGPLHELPFEALLDASDTLLFERWHVTVAPSLSALHAVRERRAKRQPLPNQSAFLGIAGGTGLSLPYREVNEVSTWFGPTAQIIMQQTDSRGAYSELAPDARHILISSHGKHVAQSRSGYLELTAPDGVATRLTAGEIAHIPLRAELVTLAACETARGEAMQSDERLDLTRAFLIAGADAVLATRWRVPEHPSTRQFLLDFYQALHQGGPGGTRLRKDEALTEARRRSRARGDQAQLWAAWVLVGDAR